jgi:hypothetical protein
MRLIILAIALVSFTTSFANNNEEVLKSFSISGKVVDNTESLTGVKIVLDGKEITVYTDFDGNFTIENVLAGEHSISLSLITYNNKVITFNPTIDKTLEIALDAK